MRQAKATRWRIAWRAGCSATDPGAHRMPLGFLDMRLGGGGLRGAALWFLLGWCGVVWGADDQAVELETVFQPAPSDVRRPITAAEKAIAEGRYSDAALGLGQLLASESADDPETQDYFLIEPDASDTTSGPQSLKAKARAMIGQLPAAGRQAYELQFGAQARALLDEALAAEDEAKLGDVMRRFFHTRAGYEACLLAGRVHLARGRPAGAALYLERLADAPAAVTAFDPELSLLLAACWWYAGDPARAQTVLTGLRSRSPDAVCRLGGRDVPLFTANNDALGWLEANIGSTGGVAVADAVQWPVYRGNAQRNARTSGSLPTMNFRWLVPITVDLKDEKAVEQITRRYREESRAALPTPQPLALGNVVVMRTPDKLLGVDFVSGKRIWVWPPWEDDSRDAFPILPSPFGVNMSADRQQELQQRIWDDAVYSQISSDGRSVFVLGRPGQSANVGNAVRQVVIGAGGIGFRGAATADSSNQLVSLSLARQGAAQWLVGGETGEDEPKLAGAFFLGPPLPLDGLLYAIAEVNGEIRLVVLDAASGRLQWQQQLAHADNRTISVDIGRQVSGASPSYDGGVLVCPTSIGAVVGVDVAARELLWGFQFPRPVDGNQPRFRLAPFNVQGLKPIDARWADASIAIASGRVLVMAIDTDQLYCLDLRTGQLAWPAQPRGDRLCLACIHNGQAMFLTADSLTAIRLADGQPAWATTVSLDGPPSGRGFYSDHFYYVPTADGEVLKIDLDASRIVQRTNVSLPLGNLVCFRDEILSQDAERLAVFWQNQPLRQRVQKALAENPDDVAMLTRYGELLLQEAKRPQAIDTFRHALRLAPEDETVRGRLVAAILDALRDDFASAEPLYSEIETLLDQPAQRAEHLRIVGGARQRQGALRQAFDAYRELGRLRNELTRNSGATEPELERMSREWSVRGDRWLQARFGELLGAATGDERDAMDQTVRAVLDQALTGGDLAELRQADRMFGLHAGAEAVRLRLARQLAKSGEILEAELVLSGLETAADPAIRGAAIAELAALLAGVRQSDIAWRYYRQLDENYRDMVCRDGQTGGQLYQQASQTAAFREADAQTAPWPRGKAEVGDAPRPATLNVGYQRLFACEPRQRSGPCSRAVAVFYDQSRNSLIIREDRGNTIATVSLGGHRVAAPDFSPTYFRIRGHLLLVSTGLEILAVDLLRAAGAVDKPTDPVLWRREVVRPNIAGNAYQVQLQVQRLANPWGQNRTVFVNLRRELVGATGPLLDRGAYYLDGRTLYCVDPLTGDTIWSRDGLPAGSDLFGDAELLFVAPPNGEPAQVFHAVDGAPAGTRPSEPLANRWATFGRRVLAWQSATADPPIAKPPEAGEDAAARDNADGDEAKDDPDAAAAEQAETAAGSLELKLYDAASGEVIWREQFPPGTRGTLVDDDEFAILQRDGRLVIRSLETAEPVLQGQIAGDAKLESLHVLRSQSQYLIATNQRSESGAASAEFQAVGDGGAKIRVRIRAAVTGGSVPLVQGALYAFDRQSGQPSWPAPVEIEQFGLPLEQPCETPVLLLLRHFTPLAGQQPRREQTSVMCLDRRNGQTLLDKTDIPTQTAAYEIVADRRQLAVTVALPTKTLLIKIQDE